MIVVEADEYDRSFLQLHPAYAMITSLDADHLDIYGDRDSMVNSYREFAGQVSPEGKLVVKSGADFAMSGLNFSTYSLKAESDYHADQVRVEDGSYVFNIVAPKGTVENLKLNWPGRHNVENAVGAYALCHACGISPEAFREALSSFQGVRRRFDYQLKTNEVVFIDDYAHHPEELRACIASVKELYPGQKILGMFQPHLFTRTRDFADGFGESLSMLDELILLDIYPARELPIPGVTSQMILDKVTSSVKQLCSRNEWQQAVMNSDARIILTLGAGDIDQLVEPVRNLLSEKYLKQNA
jgi:UDP-N-acetylmuramate--alanine ligase